MSSAARSTWSARLARRPWKASATLRRWTAIQPDYVIIGEPTECRLGYGQRGRARVIFRVPGSAGHSSADDQSGNAVYAMARLIARLETQTFPHDPLLGDAIQAPIELMSNPYPSLSTVPVECRLVIDRRVLMGETHRERAWRITANGSRACPDVTVEMDTVTYTSYTGDQIHRARFPPRLAHPRRIALPAGLPGGLHRRRAPGRLGSRSPTAPTAPTPPAISACRPSSSDPAASSRPTPWMNSWQSNSSIKPCASIRRSRRRFLA